MHQNVIRLLVLIVADVYRPQLANFENAECNFCKDISAN